MSLDLRNLEMVNGIYWDGEKLKFKRKALERAAGEGGGWAQR